MTTETTTAVSNFKGVIFETVQGTAFRTVCESLKDILVDAILHFAPEGIQLISLDNPKSVIVYMSIVAQNIERYVCTRRYRLGLNLTTLYKIVKGVTAADTLTLMYNESDPQKFQIVINNMEKRTKYTYVMHLLNLDESPLDLQLDFNLFSMVVQMPSQSFQRACKDILTCGGQFVEVKASKNCLFMKSPGSNVALELSLYDFNPAISVDDKTPMVTQRQVQSQIQNDETLSFGEFPIRQMYMFSKCSHVTNMITLYLQTDLPLVMEYQAGNLGVVRYCIASVQENKKQNALPPRA